MTILTRPGLDLAVKPSGDCTRAIPIGHDVVAANGMGTINGLHQREVSIRGGMHFDRRGTRS